MHSHRETPHAKHAPIIEFLTRDSLFSRVGIEHRGIDVLESPVQLRLNRLCAVTCSRPSTNLTKKIIVNERRANDFALEAEYGNRQPLAIIPGDIEHPDLEISAVLERNESYDVLLGSVFDGFILGTSSPRRKAQLESLYSNLNVQIKPIRGNIDTRIKKLDNKEYDAIVLAQAGLQALGIDRISTRLPIIPAVGQGIIALQTVKGSKASSIVKEVNHDLTFKQAQLERALLKGIGGDCTTKVAAHATGNNPIKLEAVYYD